MIEDLRLTDDDGELRYDEGEKTTIVALGGASAESTEYFVQYYRFDTDDLYKIDAGEEETETESEEESESEETTTEVENYGWLQVTSIIIALVLVGALIAVVIRKASEGKSNKKRKTQKYYHQGYDKTTRRTGKNDVAVPDADDSAKDYDYDNPENN